MLHAAKVICIVLCIGALASSAAVITVDPSSDLETVMRSLADGDTLLLKPGVYSAVCFRRPVRGITIKAEYQGRAWIRPRPPYECGVYADDRCAVENVIIEGLDIGGFKVDQIRFMNGKGICVRNCHVHSAGKIGIALHNCDTVLIEGCLIENGANHATYLSGDGIVVRNNCIRNNGGWGIHLWTDAPGGEIIDAVIVGNFVYGHPRGASIVVQQHDPDPTFAPYVARNLCIASINGIQLVGASGAIVEDNLISGQSAWAIANIRPQGRVYAAGNTTENKSFGMDTPVATRPAGGWTGITSQPAESPSTQPAEAP